MTTPSLLHQPPSAPRIWIAGSAAALPPLCATGIPQAIVTNPDVLAGWHRENGRAPEDTAAGLAETTGLPVFLQLRGPDADALIRQARAIRSLHPLLLPKLPATAAGLAACATLAGETTVLVTAVATLAQAAAAAAAGAQFLCPYFARLRDHGGDPAALCAASASCFARTGCTTELVPASLRNRADFESALSHGATGGILFTQLFEEILEHESCGAAMESFTPAWNSLPPGILLS